MARRLATLVVAGAVLFAAGVSCAQGPGPGQAADAERESRPLGRPREMGGQGAASRTAAGAGQSPGMVDSPLLRTGGSLALVLGLIWALAKVAQRLSTKGGPLGAALGGARAPSGIIEVLGRYPLGRGQTLVLLRVDSRVLLLAQSSPGLRLRGGAGAGAVTTLCELAAPEDVASILMKVQDAEQTAASAKFGDLLRGFDARHGDGVVEVGGRRRVGATAAGDRAEVWDVEALAGAGGGGGLTGRLRALRAGGGR